MVEKQTITKIHFLVHPFYGSRKFFRITEYLLKIFKLKASYKTYKPDLSVDALRYELQLARVWGQLVLNVAKHPDEVIVFLPLELNKRSIRFMNFVRSNIDPNHLIEEGFLNEDTAEHAFKTINNRFNVDWNNVELEGHGEMSDYCVSAFLTLFADCTKNKDLIRESRFTMDNLGKLTKDQRVSISPDTTEVIRGKERYVLKHSQLPRKGTVSRLEKLAKFRNLIRRK